MKFKYNILYTVSLSEVKLKFQRVLLSRVS